MSVPEALLRSEDSNSSFTGSKRNLEVDAVDLDFSAEKLFEYQWPQDGDGEYYLLQEQLCQFLDVKSFQRKFPDTERRSIFPEERDFLMSQGVLASVPMDFGLVAIRTDDACQIMAEHFPAKYQEYLRMVHDRERKLIVQQQEVQMAARKKSNSATYVKRAIKDAAEFNSRLNLERKEERCLYFDMQTQLIHVPRKRLKPDKTKRSRYPVSLMPGQFQEYFKRLTAEELKSLPINTIIRKPPTNSSRFMARMEPFNSPVQSQESRRNSQESESDEEGLIGSDGDEEIFSSARKSQLPDHINLRAGIHENLQLGIKNDPFCGICMKGPESNKKGLPEMLINCSQCENSGHPSCLDMNRQLVKVIQGYPWQCMECKTCTLCSNPHDEDKMMFCDNCDRGYHTYCIGLKSIPIGRWVCSKCGTCTSCLSLTPGSDQGWKQEFSQAYEDNESQFLQIHCADCSKLFRAGNFCPVCLKVYRNDESDLPMVCCDSCDRWIHTDCDGIDDRKYQEMSKDGSISYNCILCRGEKEERMVAFHKKYKTKV